MTALSRAALLERFPRASAAFLAANGCAGGPQTPPGVSAPAPRPPRPATARVAPTAKAPARKLAKPRVPFAAFLAAHGLPAPIPELRFAPPRRWRFDYAWPAKKLALEVQGGIWTAGRHSRGAAMLKEWEKLNAAAVLGWRMLYCQPKDLRTASTAETIRAALAKS